MAITRLPSKIALSKSRQRLREETLIVGWRMMSARRSEESAIHWDKPEWWWGARAGAAA
jgi:hypothetical protein